MLTGSVCIASKTNAKNSTLQAMAPIPAFMAGSMLWLRRRNGAAVVIDPPLQHHLLRAGSRLLGTGCDRCLLLRLGCRHQRFRIEADRQPQIYMIF
jgi:hypothetical protein